MEAPKCKICHERHFGLCFKNGGTPAKPKAKTIADLTSVFGHGLEGAKHQPVRWPPHDLAPPKPKKKSAQHGQHIAADGEAGVKPFSPAKPKKLNDQAKEATVGSGANSHGMVTGGQTHRSSGPITSAERLEEELGLVPGSIDEATTLHAILYRKDGTINEAAARAGHNAHMTLLMRKRRAAKKAEAT